MVDSAKRRLEARSDRLQFAQSDIAFVELALGEALGEDGIDEAVEAARAFVLAAETDLYLKGEIINVGTGQVTTMEQIAKAIVGDDESRLTFIPRRGFEVERHEADIARATAMGWKPSIHVLDWLAKFVPTLS